MPDTAAPIVLYCAGAMRSVLAAKSLQDMGYTNVQSMSGGYNGWHNQKLPVRPWKKS